MEVAECLYFIYVLYLVVLSMSVITSYLADIGVRKI